jgi:hypothetical protein
LSGNTGSSQQWYSSTDNASWGLIGGATSPTYTTPALYTTTYYLAVVCSSGCCVWSTHPAVTVNAQPTGPTLSAKTPNLAAVCHGQGVSATFNAGSGGVGCSDDYTVSIDGGAATAYTPGSTVGTTANSSIVIQGRRDACTSGAG